MISPAKHHLAFAAVAASLLFVPGAADAELIFNDPGWPSLGSYKFVPAWLRS